MQIRSVNTKQNIYFKVDALFLKTHGWLLKLVALELHVTTQQKQRRNQLRLVKLLFQRTAAAAAGNALVSLRKTYFGTFCTKFNSNSMVLLHTRHTLFFQNLEIFVEICSENNSLVNCSKFWENWSVQWCSSWSKSQNSKLQNHQFFPSCSI